MSNYQTFGSRFLALLLDGIILSPLTFVDIFFDRICSTGSPGLLIAWNLFSYAAYPLYTVFFTSRYGQTLGKMALKVKVYDVAEQRIPTLQQAVIRELPFILNNALSYAWMVFLVGTGQYTSSEQLATGVGQQVAGLAVIWLGVDVIICLTNSKRRAAHDLLANTVVLKI